MGPDKQELASPEHLNADHTSEALNTSEEEKVTSAVDTGWTLWPPSPKMQIALIAIGFGIFNLILIAIWAVVMVYRF